MTREESALEGIAKYAREFKNDCSKVEMTVDLALLIYTHDDLQEIMDYRIADLVQEMLDQTE